MPQPKVEVKTPKIKISVPSDPQFWKAVGFDAARTIRTRTESGLDADGHVFRPYDPQTAKYRASKGRQTSPVNLTFSGRMLGAIASGVRETRTGVELILSGMEGTKAYHNMVTLKRRFFELGSKDVKKILTDVKAWMKKKNKLK